MAACKQLSFTAADHLPASPPSTRMVSIPTCPSPTTETAHAWEQYQEASDAEAEEGHHLHIDAARRSGKSTFRYRGAGFISWRAVHHAPTLPRRGVHRWLAIPSSPSTGTRSAAFGLTSPLNRDPEGVGRMTTTTTATLGSLNGVFHRGAAWSCRPSPSPRPRTRGSSRTPTPI